jgi:hypothetical protein
MVTALGAGAPVKTACAVTGIDQASHYRWMQIGRGEHPTVRKTREYSEYYEEVTAAIGQGDLELLASVRSTVRGRKCQNCDGNGAVGENRCVACRGSGLATNPDGRLGLMVLERRHPEFRKPDPQIKVEQTTTAEVVVTGRLEVEVTNTAMVLDLHTLAPEQLLALGGGSAPAALIGADVIDAEVEGGSEGSEDSEVEGGSD